MLLKPHWLWTTIAKLAIVEEELSFSQLRGRIIELLFSFPSTISSVLTMHISGGYSTFCSLSGSIDEEYS